MEPTIALKPAAPDMQLSTGRGMKHTRCPDGSQRVIATPGPEAMTEAEWQEYCERVKAGAK